MVAVMRGRTGERERQGAMVRSLRSGEPGDRKRGSEVVGERGRRQRGSDESSSCQRKMESIEEGRGKSERKWQPLVVFIQVRDATISSWIVG